MNFSAKTLDENRIVLLLADSPRLKQTNTAVVKELTSNGYSMILVSITLPNIVIRRTYESAGIDMSKVFVVDTVTKYSGGQGASDDPRCRYISNPGNLTDIGIVVTEGLKTLEGSKKCLFFDDISTMLLYSPSVKISQFIHFITGKLRLLDAAGVLLAVGKGLDPSFQTQLSTFADLVISEDPEGNT